jgi:hypothetical protein
MAWRSDASRTEVDVSDIPISPKDGREVEMAGDQMNLLECLLLARSCRSEMSEHWSRLRISRRDAATLESTRLALYFRAQLVVRTVQPNMDKCRSRAAPQTQRATPLCTTTQRFAMRRSPRQRKAVQSNLRGLRLLLS